MKYSSTEQTASWFRSQSVSGLLVLKPPFQRKLVWTLRQKAPLIESLLLDLPVPEVYLQQNTTETGETMNTVVDGQQRIQALLEFVDPDQGFPLRYIDAQSPWYNATFNDLLPDDRKKLFSYRFAVRRLESVDDEEIRALFRRLNRYSVVLRPQELRNATYSGPLIQLSEELADDDFWTEHRIVTAQSIRRMGDIEFVSELIIGLANGPQGGSAKAIDEFYAVYEAYEDTIPEQTQIKRSFTRNLEFLDAVYGEDGLRQSRWRNKTDFYSLFVVLGTLLTPKTVRKADAGRVANILREFGGSVDAYLQDRTLEVTDTVRGYTLAVEKGANERSRRAARHRALLEEIGREFGVE